MTPLANAQPIQPTSVVENSKPSAPVSAASGPRPSPARRNQYAPSPAPTSLSAAMRVSAGAAGRIHASHVNGNSNAVCGLARNGAPAYAFGTQRGTRPAWISPALHKSAG